MAASREIGLAAVREGDARELEPELNLAAALLVGVAGRLFGQLQAPILSGMDLGVG